MATVEDTHTRLCICALRKIMLIFLSAPFMGKSGGSQLPLTGQLGLDVIYLLEGS